MKRILVLGAGQSSPSLIRYLLEQSSNSGWKVTVADLDINLAKQRINGHENGEAVEFNVDDIDALFKLVEQSDIVANLLPPQLQHSVVEACIHHSTHMVSASYESPWVPKLHNSAVKKGIIILNEMGLDPGLDHMSAIDIITRVRAKGGRIRSFCSYGSGVPAPDSDTNPFHYVITWNPRNVVMAGQSGAQYYENEQIKVVPSYRVFQRTWPVEVDGVGVFEAYPNRDSLVYLDHFDLDYAHTMIRGTLRYQGFSELWLQIVRLGLPNDTLTIPDLKNKTWQELVEMFLPEAEKADDVPTIRRRVARHLGINPTGAIMDNLEWLGIFSDEKIGFDCNTAAEAMVHLVQEKFKLKENGRDMVILLHEFEVDYPENGMKKEKITSTFVYYGDPGGETAMAKTVGLPAAIAIKRILNGELTLTGCYIPTTPEIYEPVCKELEEEFGIKFIEKVEPLT